MSTRRNSSRTTINAALNTAAVQTSNSKTIAPDTAVVRELSGGAFAPTITAVAITDSDYNIIDDTNVSTGGGYIRITGTGFVSGCVVYIGGVAALSTTLLNSTQVNVQISATSSNTLHVYLVNPDGSAAIYLSGVTFTGVPSWATDPTITGLAADVAFSVSLSATSNSTVSYSLTAGSALPPGTTLSSAGVFSGTVTGLSADTTYSFSVTATDLELQDTPRTFSVTVVLGDTYFYATPVLLTGEANVWIRDSSVNNFQLTVGNDTKPIAFSPYNTNWSGLFNGSTDYLAGTCGALGAGDFTVEFWSNQTAATSRMYYFTIGSGPEWSDSNGVQLIEYDGYYALTCGTANSITVRTNAARNQWVHVAVVRYNGVVTLYYNGVAAGTTLSNTTNLTGTLFRVGLGNVNSGGWLSYSGYMSNFRIVAGTAVYTSNFTPPTTNLTAIANTRILTLQNNRFIDNTGVSITVAGTPQIKNFSPFADTDLTTGSAYFDGTGDYLTIPDSAALELGAGDFCVECWIYPTSVTGTGIVIDKRSGGYAPLLLWRSTSTLQLYMSLNGSSWGLANGVTVGALSVNRWYHVAIFRVGTSLYTSFNGVVSLVTASGSGTLVNNATNWYIGTETNGSTNPWTGYISDLRFVIGSGVYTSANFTPTTSSLSSIPNTQLLTLQYRQGENNHRFVDESSSKAFITRNGNATQGSFSPFSADDGYWSISYPANAQRTYATMSTSIIDVKATATFTVEGWVMLTSSTGGAIMVATTDFSTGVNWYIGVDSSTNKPIIYWYTGSVVTCLGSTVLNVNRWYFLQFRANNGALTIGVNGVAETLTGTTTMGAPGNSTYLSFGCERSFNHPCYLYDVRISNSVRNYTLPTEPMTSDANTKFLGMRKRSVVDESSLATTLTNTGLTQPFSPYGSHVSPRVPYSPATHGGSMYIDGTGDYLNLDGNSLLAFGTSDFSIELWFYFSVLDANNHMIYDSRPGADGAYPTIYVTNNGLIYYVSSAGRISTSAGTIQAGQWYHMVVSRVSGSTRMFLNGTQVGSTYVDSTTYLNGASRPFIGIAGSPAGSYGVQGYISGLNVTRNTGVTSVTVPTAPPTLTANTVMLSNFTNAGIVNATGRNNFETAGAVTISNAASKFGSGSISFPGALTAYLVAPTNPLLDFATGDFTVECWVYFNSVAADQGLFGGSTTNAWEIRWRTSTGLNLGRLNTAFDSTFAWSPSISTWYHVAVTRSGTSVRAFINGTQIGSTSTNSNTYNSGTLFYVGITDTSNNAFNGYLDDIRITKGYARYTANFTAPTSAFLTK